MLVKTELFVKSLIQLYLTLFGDYITLHWILSIQHIDLIQKIKKLMTSENVLFLKEKMLDLNCEQVPHHRHAGINVKTSTKFVHSCVSQTKLNKVNISESNAYLGEYF